MPPKISLVTPSFNQGYFLEETIQSVVSQNYPNLEYIIIDGSSQDNSIEVIQKYQSYLTYWQSMPDNGQSDALNQGFSHTTGEIMGWLNSDDLLAEDALFRMAEAYQAGPHWWTGNSSRICLEGTLIHLNPLLVRSIALGDLLHARVNVNQVSTFWTRELWDLAGGYVAPLNLAMDFDLWLRFSQIVPSTPIKDTLGVFRNHSDAKTGTDEGMKKYLEECDTLRLQEYQKRGMSKFTRSALINLWTRYHLMRTKDWKAWVGRRPIPFV